MLLKEIAKKIPNLKGKLNLFNLGGNEIGRTEMGKKELNLKEKLNLLSLGAKLLIWN